MDLSYTGNIDCPRLPSQLGLPCMVGMLRVLGDHKEICQPSQTEILTIGKICLNLGRFSPCHALIVQLTEVVTALSKERLGAKDAYKGRRFEIMHGEGAKQ